MTKLFGTDGVRGIVDKELTEDLAYRLGQAAGHYLAEGNGSIVVGRDTRGHGERLEKALVKGIISTGADALLADIVPTPAIAFLARELETRGGIVISASHNPPEYNGIKFLSSEGFKLPDEVEAEIEEICENLDIDLSDSADKKGKIVKVADAAERYIKHCLTATSTSLAGLKVAFDLGHGAAYQTTPEAFRRLGAEVTTINDDYNGTDINVGCGSTNLSVISKLVKESGADFGFAHDGDADRVLAVDERGNEIDGDQMMAICALDLKEKGKLTENTVVSTVMCNLGFKKALEKEGIRVLQTAVGDRYVLTEMKATGATFGGEQSGHIIFLDHNTTGDGLITAIQLASVVKRSGKTLSELAQVMTKYPQVLVNVQVKDKSLYSSNQKISAVVQQEEKALGDKGRILVRPSGTEHLVRVMTEAETPELARSVVDNIVSVVKKELN